MNATMDAREQRGLVIAATCKVVQKRGEWSVPSSTQKGVRYAVNPDADSPTCSCPDFEERRMACKHVFAVRFTQQRKSHRNGTTTITETITVSETVKRTYSQKSWPAYNAAQTNERRWFLSLLADLCRPIPQPERKPTRGQQPVLLSDAIFAACFKVFSGFSARRFTCDLEAAAEAGHITKPIHFNSVLNVLDTEEATPILSDLIIRSATPLRAVETEFAVDSTGFSGCRFDRWFDEKWGVARKRAAWTKAHIITGTRTNVIAAAIMKDGGDSPMLPELVQTAAKTFNVKEVSADKAYPSYENFDAVDAIGAKLFAAFKEGTTAAKGGVFEKMFHYFSLNKEEYLAHYHRRSMVESTFSSVKRVLGDSVRAKSELAMKNEVLAKFVCHNIRCVVSAIYERGIDPTFLGLDGKVDDTPRDVLRFPAGAR